ncbi:MAG: hypothetical protein WCI48_07930 [Bacteroidota bacterium]|jgi:hypothetical protein
MNTDQADIELIERFINGKLNHDELVDFETRLEEDHEFARKFRLRKAFPSLFNASGDDLIVQDLKENPELEIPEITAREEKPRGFKPGYIIWPFVLLIIALALAWFFFMRPKPVADEAEQQTKTPVKTAVPVKQPVPVKTQPTAGVNAANQSPSEIKPAATPVTATPKSQQEPQKPAATVHKAVELLAPENNMVVSRGEDVVFKWKMATDTFTNFYLIAEAGNKLAWWRGIKPGVRELIIPAVNFKAGKFYWYVGSREVKRTLIIME